MQRPSSPLFFRKSSVSFCISLNSACLLLYFCREVDKQADEWQNCRSLKYVSLLVVRTTGLKHASNSSDWLIEIVTYGGKAYVHTNMEKQLLFMTKSITFRSLSYFIVKPLWRKTIIWHTYYAKQKTFSGARVSGSTVCKSIEISLANNLQLKGQ